MSQRRPAILCNSDETTTGLTGFILIWWIPELNTNYY